MNRTEIIAEIGINHNGDIEIAKKLIDTAKFAGADMVKFQKRNIDKVYSQDYLNQKRESPWGTTQRAQKFALEFKREEYDEIDKYCKSVGMKWIASPWDLDSFKFLRKYNLPHQKLASALLTYNDLVLAMAKEEKHTFISTGMSTIEEIDKAVKIFEKYKCPYSILHCNSQYPMPDHEANLKMIPFLKERYGDFPYFRQVGYSGHEVGLITSIAAVVMGAEVIERHITLDRSMYGSDQSASIEPIGLYKLVEYIRTVETTMGDGIKRVTAEEEKCKAKLRRNKDF